MLIIGSMDKNLLAILYIAYAIFEIAVNLNGVCMLDKITQSKFGRHNLILYAGL